MVCPLTIHSLQPFLAYGHVVGRAVAQFLPRNSLIAHAVERIVERARCWRRESVSFAFSVYHKNLLLLSSILLDFLRNT
jgi:hypothetical protein